MRGKNMLAENKMLFLAKELQLCLQTLLGLVQAFVFRPHKSHNGRELSCRAFRPSLWHISKRGSKSFTSTGGSELPLSSFQRTAVTNPCKHFFSVSLFCSLSQLQALRSPGLSWLCLREGLCGGIWHLTTSRHNYTICYRPSCLPT